MKTKNVLGPIAALVAMSCTTHDFVDSKELKDKDKDRGDLPDDVLQVTGREMEAGKLWAASPHGDLCELEAFSGERKEIRAGRVQDFLLTAGGEHLVTIESTDETLELVKRVRKGMDWEKETSVEIGTEGAKLIGTGEYDIGLTYEMGARLFVARAGKVVSEYVGTPSSAVSRRGANSTQVLLLVPNTEPWEIRTYEVSGAGLKRVTTATISSSGAEFEPRMVDTGDELLLIDIVMGKLTIRRQTGETIVEQEITSAEDRYVEDAILDEETSRILAITGPKARFHSISIEGKPSATIEVMSQGDIHHESTPRRLLAMSKELRRVYLAMKHRVVAVDIEKDGSLSLLADFDGKCGARSVFWQEAVQQ